MPEIASPNAYSRGEMRELVSFAKGLGITLIPELETLGHSRYITGLPKYRHLLESAGDFTAICPLLPETRQIMSRLLAEVAEVFDSPWIHVGLDEVSFGQHPHTRAALETRTERSIFLEYVAFIHETVSRLGRRMILWGDRRTVALGLAPFLPKDVIVANWQYSAAISTGQIRHFLDEGLDVILCPALITYDQQFLPGEDFAIANVRAMAGQVGMLGKGKILGMITTLWTGTRYFHDAQWAGLHLACDLVSDGPTVEVSASMSRFVAQFYGCIGKAHSLEDALRSVLALAPARQEYQAILTLSGLDEADLPDWESKAAAWRAVQKTLHANRQLIHEHLQAYDTFLFAVVVLTHLYDRAAAIQARDSTERQAALAALLNQGRALYQQMLAVWDQERFADDPKKFAACLEFDRTEHILLLFRESLETFSDLVDESLLCVSFS